jgi:hypothetical protein
VLLIQREVKVAQFSVEDDDQSVGCVGGEVAEQTVAQVAQVAADELAAEAKARVGGR